MLRIEKRKRSRFLVSGLLAAVFVFAGVGYALVQPAPQSASAATLCRYEQFSYDLTPSDRQRYCTKKIQGILNSISWRQQVSGESKRIYADWSGYLEVDGIYGAKTQASVKRFQDRVGGIAIDGVVGRYETWPKLCDPPSPDRVQVNVYYLMDGGYKYGACRW